MSRTVFDDAKLLALLLTALALFIALAVLAKCEALPW